MRLLEFSRLILWLCILICTACAGSSLPTDEGLRLYTEAMKLYQGKQLDEAQIRLEKLRADEPGFFQGRLLLAKAYYFSAQYEQAFKELSDLCSGIHSYTDAEIWLARTELQLDRHKSSEARLKNLLQYNSDNPHILNLLARIYEQNGDMEKAITYYKTAALTEAVLRKNKRQLNSLYTRLGFTGAEDE